MALYRVPVTLDGRHLAPLIEADGRDQARSKAEAVVRARRPPSTGLPAASNAHAP